MAKGDLDLMFNGLSQARDEFYLDAINAFKSLINDCPDSDLADDALFNIGLCYYHLKQFSKAIESYQNILKEYPDSTISALIETDEYGKTAAKALYNTIVCNLAESDLPAAQKNLELLKQYPDSYVVKNDKKITFEQLALNIIDYYKENK